MMAIDLSCKIEGHFLGGSQVIGHARRILLSFAVAYRPRERAMTMSLNKGRNRIFTSIWRVVNSQI